MKSYTTIFKNNKFYEAATGQRIYPKDGAKLLLASDNESFDNKDPLNLPHQLDQILNLADKLKEIQAVENLHSYHLFYPANTHLFFKVSLSKRKTNYEELYYRFRLTLLEDLYLHFINTWKTYKPAETFECKCIVDKVVFGNVEYFEPIYANSLNEAYSKTRQFYFPNQGTPGASIYKVIFTHNDLQLDFCRNEIPKKKFITHY